VQAGLTIIWLTVRVLLDGKEPVANEDGRYDILGGFCKFFDNEVSVNKNVAS